MIITSTDSSTCYLRSLGQSHVPCRNEIVLDRRAATCIIKGDFVGELTPAYDGCCPLSSINKNESECEGK